MGNEESKFKDELTGIYIKDFFFEAGSYLLTLATRSKVPLSICVVDIDHLSRVNDRFGHPIGDKVIASVAQTVVNKCRRSDLLGYLGEGKIAIVLYNISGINTGFVLNALRKKIEKNIGTLNQSNLKVTVSIGACVMHGKIDNESLEVIFNRAYLAVDKAKAAGRDRVEIY